jgi:sugar/nucleoside kinase (ribokinase family)
MNTHEPVSIAAFCNPLLDIIAHVDYPFLEELGVRPGTMNLVEIDGLDRVRRRLGTVEILPGGSGANTARGFAWLNRGGGLPSPVFFGSVGRDETGAAYEGKLAEAGVISGLARKNEPSGVSVIVVTPDFERTMFTHLGACRRFEEIDVDFSLVREAAVLHLTGYLWDTDNQRRVAERAAVEARQAGVPVSLDLADPFVVTRYREEFLRFIPDWVDLLFGNRDEFSLLCGEDGGDEAILARARELTPRSVIKAGARGAYVVDKRETTLVPGLRVKARDTTGAGDSFAAGYLYGRLSGKDPHSCARLGNKLAASVVSVEGCDYSKIDAEVFTAEMEW